MAYTQTNRLNAFSQAIHFYIEAEKLAELVIVGDVNNGVVVVKKDQNRVRMGDRIRFKASLADGDLNIDTIELVSNDSFSLAGIVINGTSADFELICLKSFEDREIVRLHAFVKRKNVTPAEEIRKAFEIILHAARDFRIIPTNPKFTAHAGRASCSLVFFLGEELSDEIAVKSISLVPVDAQIEHSTTIRSSGGRRYLAIINIANHELKQSALDFKLVVVPVHGKCFEKDLTIQLD
jgi:hypothetical protein